MRIATLSTKTTAKQLKADTAIVIRQHRANSTNRSIIDAYRASHSLCERCAAGGYTRPTEHVHHIRPLSEGGNSQPDNLLAVCRQCHELIHYEPFEQQLAYKVVGLGVPNHTVSTIPNEKEYQL